MLVFRTGCTYRQRLEQVLTDFGWPSATRFELGTLDGMFRVAVFIVVGLVLLGMGAGYARLLDRQDQQQDHAGVSGATQ